MLPVILAAIECPTHTIVDGALRSLPVVLPVLDFSTIKNELFPSIAAVFSKTNSLAIKVRGLQAFVILCGGTPEGLTNDDDLNGLAAERKKTSSSSALDKFTMQEKIVPLIKVIKTKEPGVMMASLNVLRIVGQAADAEFVALEILPILWHMSLGPLLDLKQFQAFMELTKSLSRRVEDEQTRKLQELSGNSGSATAAPNEDFMAFGGVSGTAFDASNGTTADDFEALVKGRASTGSANNAAPSWEEAPSLAQARASPKPPTFSWSTPSPTTGPTQPPAQAPLKPQASSYRTVTPDLARFETMTPASTQFSQPLQPTSQSSFAPPPPPQPRQLQSKPSMGSINWSAATAPASKPWGSSTSTPASSNFGGNMNRSMSNLAIGQQPPANPTRTPSFNIPPPPPNTTATSPFSIAPPPMNAQPSPWASSSQIMGSLTGSTGMGGAAGRGATGSTGGGQQKSGLDKYESLI